MSVSMNVTVVSRKLIKPVTPTPPNLKTYPVSLKDVSTSPMNMPLVLYYTSANCSINNETMTTKSLEESLAKILPHFYPLAGRYIKNEYVVDCSDQGVEFVEAKIADDVVLLDVIGSNAAKHQLDDLLPRGTCTSEDITDPLLSIQVSRFSCGGMSIGVSMSHRITDGPSLATFLSHWANANHSTNEVWDIVVSLPTFDSPSLFPTAKGYLTTNVANVPEIKTSSGDPRIVARRFLFKKEAIMALRNGIPESISNTRVRLVCALIAEAFIRVERAKDGGGRQSKACVIGQAVNIRGRMVPPLPMNSCGNLSLSAYTPRFETENLGIQDLVCLLTEAIDESVSKLARQDNGQYSLLDDKLVSAMEGKRRGDLSFLWFSANTRFGFYEIDFGWGKPVWMSVGTMVADNIAILMDDKDGGGIEAWVSLDRDYMPHFEQDEQIKLYASN